MIDVAIIGGGPAGVSSALYIKRSGFNPIIFDSDDSSLKKAKKIDNYYGFKNGISGKELYQDGLSQARNLGIEIINEEVLDIEYLDENSFLLKTVNNEYQVRFIVLATGMKQNDLDIKGLKENVGNGVSYCATCDGFFYRKKDVCVIGNTLYTYQEAKALLPLANSITILTNNKELTFNDDRLSFITKEIDSINCSNKKEVIFKDGSRKIFDGIFVANGKASSFTFAKKLGIEENKKNINVNQEMMTNIDRIYACGDNTNGMMQVVKAVYQGAMVAESIVSRLR